MQYIIHVFEGNEGTALTAPVGDIERTYLGKMIETLRPLSDEEYMTGPAAIVQTAARFSYVLDPEAKCVYWIIEWSPGLLLVRFDGAGELAWSGIQSLREHLSEEEIETRYGMDPQYTLVFRAWDAQFDERDREDSGFRPAPEALRLAYVAAFDRVNGLGEEMAQRFNDGHEEWMRSSIARTEILNRETHHIE